MSAAGLLSCTSAVDFYELVVGTMIISHQSSNFFRPPSLHLCTFNSFVLHVSFLFCFFCPKDDVTELNCVNRLKTKAKEIPGGRTKEEEELADTWVSAKRSLRLGPAITHMHT